VPRYSPAILLLILLNLIPVATIGQVQVVVSIKPLQLIAESLLGDGGTVTTLLPGDRSPHHYSITPADRFAIADAKLVIYTGEELETQLHSILERVKPAEQVLRLLSLENLILLSLGEEQTAAGTTHSHGRYDPHVWLSPANGGLIALAIADRLGAADPENAENYYDRARRLVAELALQESSWRQRLLQTAGQPYIVYHDAFSYFEGFFELQHALSLVADPEVQPGIRQILEVRSAIDQLQPVCLLAEPFANQATIDTMLDGYSLSVARLDILGRNLTEGQGYIQLLNSVINQFYECFQAKP